MQTGKAQVHEFRIDDLRRDAVLVARGAFVLILMPAMGLVLILQDIVRDLPRINWAALADTRPWLLAVVLVALHQGMSRLGGSMTVAGLRFIRAALVLTPVAMLAYEFLSLPSSDMQSIDWREFSKLPENPAPVVAALALMLALVWWVVWVPAAAATRLLNARLEGAGTTYAELMSGTADTGGNKSHAAYSAIGFRSRALYAAAIVIGLVSAVAVIWMLAQGWSVYALTFEFAAIYVLMMLVRRARMGAAANAEKVMLADPRPPVLYLRAFQDDATLMQAEWDVAFQSGAGRLSTTRNKEGAVARLWRRFSIGMLSTSGRLEEVIALDMRRLGPFVAIGSPNEPLPMLGAARAYHDTDTWRSAVVRWVDLAQAIVKIAGPTEWVRWELDTIIERGALTKLVLLMPPAPPEGRAERWRNMMAELGATPWAPALALVEPRTLVAVCFHEGGAVSVVSGGKGRMLDYQIGMKIVMSRLGRATAH